MRELCALPDVNWAKQSQRQHSQNVPTSTICDQAYSTLVQEGRCDFFVRSCFGAKRQVVESGDNVQMLLSDKQIPAGLTPGMPAGDNVGTPSRHGTRSNDVSKK